MIWWGFWPPRVHDVVSILGYHARLSRGVIALIDVRLINRTPDCVDRFQRMAAEMPAIIDDYKTSGDADYLLKVVVADLTSLSALISLLMSGRQRQCVAQVKTSVVLTRLQENGVIIPSFAAHPSDCQCVGCTSGPPVFCLSQILKRDELPP